MQGDSQRNGVGERAIESVQDQTRLGPSRVRLDVLVCFRLVEPLPDEEGRDDGVHTEQAEEG